MKSMVQEGSSVAKAIDKAWELAGKPSEFTIKVMQVEERNFFGMVKKSAVVSIVYEPRGSAEAKPVRQPRPDQRGQSRHRSDDSRSSHNYQNNDHGQRERKRNVSATRNPAATSARAATSTAIAVSTSTSNTPNE